MSSARAGIVLAAFGFALGAAGPACTCSKGAAPGSDAWDGAAGEASDEGGAADAAAADGGVGGISAPIAAARTESGHVVVVALDVAAKALRVQKFDANDAIVAERTVLEGIAWSGDAELKVAPAGAGVAVVWRGQRGGKLVRHLVVLGADLAPRGEPMDIAASSCATHEAMWSTDGTHVRARPWTGRAVYGTLPKDKDAVLACGVRRAFAVLDEETGTAAVGLGADSGAGAHDAGAARASTTGPRDAGSEGGLQISAPVAMLTEAEFGEDEQRERAEYTVGDDLGVVRLATSGAVAVRELTGAGAGPLRKLKTVIPKDDDVVAVDASSRALAIVFTEDVGEACSGDGGAAMSSSKVMVLRIDRTTWEESTHELSPGMCGREVGPFFTSAVGDAVSVAWVERVPVIGKTHAPIAGLVHRRIPATGPLTAPLGRIDQAADALVDAGCDAERCYAVALARKPGADVMVPGFARVLRY